MYQALYRKWRPMVFSDVVGQRHVTDTLKKQIETARLSHAYLFTGTRGTGKTTCAKILAKAANCQHPVGGEPCNTCPSCVGINNGSITDVSEIDAASYTGVDNIRAIRDETAYLPAEARMRVYIIDECHMLSAGANNALLKTLEEPPSHVLFILATTELHKVPTTILSRCQSFTFKRLQSHDIALRLLEIAAGENIPLEENAAHLIARLADGALRDAISMLDQCAASTAGVIGTNQVLAVLGLAGGIDTMRLASAIASRNTSEALNLLADLYAKGKELSSLLGELSSLLRDLLVLKTTGSHALMTGNYDQDAINQIDINRPRLIYMIQQIQETLSRMQRSQNRRVDAELCLISLCDETLGNGLEGLAARIERLESGAYLVNSRSAAVGSTAPSGKGVSADAPPWEVTPAYGSKTTEQPSPETVIAGSDRGVPPERPMDAPDRAKASGSSNAGGTGSSGASGGNGGFWGDVLKGLRARISVSVYAHLNMIKVPVLEGSHLHIVTDSAFSQNLLNKQDLLAVINEVAGSILGREIHTDVIPADKYMTQSKQSAGVDKLDPLIQRSKQYDNITIE